MIQKVNIALVGLGRLGIEYGRNLTFKISNAHLIAVCSVSKVELEFAKSVLGIDHLYTDYDEMLQLTEIDAVFVLSSTDMHAEHMIKALKAGKHVFSEKPLAITLSACQRVADFAASKPELKCVVGFVRRFDPSYKYAKEKISDGTIGKPFLVRSQTVDKDTEADFQIQFVGKSGGIFHDFNVHDIDLARWYLESEFESVYALGGAYKYPAFEDAGDADNVMTTCQLKNGTMAVISASRTAMHGHDTYTEITGTEGTLRIGRPAAKNRVEIYDKYGVRKECVATFWERFEDAFLIMTQDFVNCILDDRNPDLSIIDALKATQAAIAFTTSFKENRVVNL